MTSAGPFLRWAGGKTYLLPEIKKRIPSTWNAETDLYVEPFLGAGALFWELAPKHAILNDSNSELIDTWFALRFHVEHVIDLLACYETEYRKDPETFYYQMRTAWFDNLYCGDVTYIAAGFIFLNRACFNGLYRVNKQGGFNVPWGREPRATICNADLLRACAVRLQGIGLSSGCFGLIGFDRDPRGVLVYCDPPYVPISKTANFTSYTKDGFSYADQLRLATKAAEWRDRGAHVILSQAAYEPLIDQYRHLGFTCDLVQVPRRVNSKGTGRGLVGEYLIY